MSELVNAGAAQGNFRRQLLTSVSALALLASVYGTREARADDSDHPIVWIEVGGAFDQISAGETGWSPPDLTPPISKPTPLPFGKLPATGFDTDLKLSFVPEDSDWIYSASIRYGRAQFGPRAEHDQSYKVNVKYSYFNHEPKYHLTNYNFADTSQRGVTTHAIVDFQAGKDFGLGVFGGKSTISFGIRVAQLNERAQDQLTAFTAESGYLHNGEIGHKAELLASRSFNGGGPSISWDESAPFVGSLSNGFAVDWGANAAILFGRQKANVLLQTKVAQYHPNNQTVLSHATQPSSRNKTVVVPNLGGFAGVSWRLPDVKVSLGYRADFFFGAIDGGLLTSQKETRGFYGPFANVSIGIGG